MLRILAAIAFIVAIILFAVCALGNNVAPTTLDWGFVSTAAGLLCLALEGVAITRTP